MFRNSYQHGMLTVFFSCGSKPLNIWETHTKGGYIERFLDQDIKSMVLEIGGTNVSTTFIQCPKGKTVLGIAMPFLVMIVKNLKKYFTFEVTILDETGTRRRFRASNFQSSTQILPLCTVMPISLSEGWNQVQFNLAEFTRRAYNKQFVEVQKIKINANVRLRRVYFAERLMTEEELPPEYKLFFPLTSKTGKKLQNQRGESEQVIEKETGGVVEKKSSIATIKSAKSQSKGAMTQKVTSKISGVSVTKSQTVPSQKSLKSKEKIADEAPIEKETKEVDMIEKEVDADTKSAEVNAEETTEEQNPNQELTSIREEENQNEEENMQFEGEADNEVGIEENTEVVNDDDGTNLQKDPSQQSQKAEQLSQVQLKPSIVEATSNATMKQRVSTTESDGTSKRPQSSQLDTNAMVEPQQAQTGSAGTLGVAQSLLFDVMKE